MSDWKSRLLVESEELEAKIDALYKFINNKEAFEEIDIQMQILMEHQLQTMIQYIDILQQRIALVGFVSKPKADVLK